MWPDLSLQVLNVGDGACSIVRAGLRELALVDCGSWRSHGTHEAELVVSTLGRRLRDVSTVVVSHFDADHWRGLQALPSVAARDNVPAQVAIYYPGLPDMARETVAAYFALKAVDGSVSVRALDLLDAWRAVASVAATPLFAGDTLKVGAQEFHALWPPRALPSAWSRAASRTLRELSDLAEGMPALQHALDEAYHGAWPGTGQEAALARSDVAAQAWPASQRHAGMGDMDERQRRRTEAEVARDLAAQGVAGIEETWGVATSEGGASLSEAAADLEPAHEFDGEPDAERALEPDEGGGESGHSELFSVGRGDFPQRRALRDLARRIGVLNNHLSLVVASDDGRLLMLGDLQGWSLRRLGAKIQHDRFALALAPHHGTVRLPKGFPPVGMCILQNGPSHYERRARHVGSHHCQPFSTEESGGFAVPPWWFLFL